jgi:(E)-4-hydroxy-3-methylbut-2-enyl-diphosphate synthase
VADFSKRENITPASLFAVGYQYSIPLDKWNLSETACDYLYLGGHQIDFKTPGTLGLIYDYSIWQKRQEEERTYPLLGATAYLTETNTSNYANFVSGTISDFNTAVIDKLKTDATAVLMLRTTNAHGMAEQRRFFVSLIEAGCKTPVIVCRGYDGNTFEQLQLFAATDIGGLLIDGLGDGVMICAAHGVGDKQINDTAFTILQATRTRISKTEYISCPSCGRTLFDLQETTGTIRSRTNHLKGVKIGIMGCIVNGPGEMADADYGYVGSGPGRITLYKGKEVVRRNVPTNQAVDELINLIRENGDWIDVPAEM